MLRASLKPLAWSAGVGLVVLAGFHGLRLAYASEESPPPSSAKEANRAVTSAANDSKISPIIITDDVVETRTAVTPKPLTESIKRGLAYLVKNQQPDGGWNQGGGWRTTLDAQRGGRIEGPNVSDPSDVGNTCIALLALIRAGNTPTEGEYKEAVSQGLDFVLSRIEKSNQDDLYVTDVRNTQLQSKIGPYIDTFLANLVLAELKGKAGQGNKRLIAGLEKTMNKIVRHQTADGQFAGNHGWAPVLSLSVANKGVARARQMGVQVDRSFLARAAEQASAAVAGKPTSGAGVSEPIKDITASDAVKTRSITAGPAGPAMAAGVAGDAGVSLYRIAQGASNSQDIVNALKFDADKAQNILRDAKASQQERRRAEQTLQEYRKAIEENAKNLKELSTNVRNESFVAGFGSNGGEEFLSFLNISETLVLKGGKEWEDWDGKMRQGLEKAQNQDGSWSGQHCITGKTFCTAAALLVMLADRTPFPVDILQKKDEPVTTPSPGNK